MVERQGEESRSPRAPYSPLPPGVEPHAVQSAGREAGGLEGVRLDAAADAPDPDPDTVEPADDTDPEALVADIRARLSGPRRGRRGKRTVPAQQASTRVQMRPEQRLLILDTWVRSKLPAREFSVSAARAPPGHILSTLGRFVSLRLAA